jgi:hypothetical protein
VGHPRTGTEAEKDNENVSLTLFYHALSSSAGCCQQVPAPLGLGQWTRVLGDLDDIVNNMAPSVDVL